MQSSQSCPESRRHPLLSPDPGQNPVPDDFPLALGPLLYGRREQDDGVVTVRLRGEFDVAAVEPVNALLGEVEAGGPSAVVLDLTALTFLDSSGARQLINAHERSQGAWSFAVLNGSGPAHRALTLMGIDQLLTMASSLDELRAELPTRDA